MKKFKHSGTLGDIIYSLPIMQHFGGGEFYLHLNQINWIGKHYYGSAPNPFHQGRMTQQDLEFMRTFFEAQPYITKFDALDDTVEITHNLDKFRPLFVNHPGNYVDTYATAFNIKDPETCKTLRNTPWLYINDPITYKDRPIIVNRTERWIPPTLSPNWIAWREQEFDKKTLFVGLPQEYEKFIRDTGWRNIEYLPTPDLLTLARVIAGCEEFIGNQSLALSLAIGLGVNYSCEARKDLPTERNECVWDHPKGRYF